MEIQFKTDEGTKIISCDYLQYGDYDNSCAVERANVRWLEENDKISRKELSGYGGVKAWILDTEENRELLNSLENYPCFDDELFIKIEMEIEGEYIKDNDDIWRCTPESLKSVLELCKLRSIDPEVYYEAKNESNEYFIVESGGNGYINLEELAPTYNELLKEKYPFIKPLCDLFSIIDVKPADYLPGGYDSAETIMQDMERGMVEIDRDMLRGLVGYAVALENQLQGVAGHLNMSI